MDWLRELIRSAIESFPIDAEKKDRLKKKLLGLYQDGSVDK